jgi:signal transduction histidine kinase/DNA-binding response OmpR family regulator
MALNFVDEDKQVLYLEKLKGDLPEETIKVLQGINIPLSHSENVFIVSLKSKKPLYLEYADGVETPQDGLDGQLIKLLPAKSLISFPLIIDDKAIGVLTFVDIHKHFNLDEKDIEHMGQYVTYIVSAIRNAKNYKEIQEANIAAINANKAKSQFLANMSHELRTPMNAVIGYSEMLEEDAEDQGFDEMIPDLQKIRKAGTHLLSLINDVLDLSKIEADKIEFYPVRFNASGLLNDIEATAKPLFEKNNNRFEHKQINQLHEGFIDQTRLSQVILNLLSNAAKFTHDGLITLCAERHTISGIDWFTFKVTDNGIGMSEEQLQRIFDPFSQADASTTREYGGTGLGLSISRKLCELMGGTLTVESEVNVGSTFIIKIPAETVMIDNKDQEAYTIIDDSPSTSDSRHTILVIDDDENIRDIMNRVLTKEGYQVYTAASGEVGIEMALLYKPNVITLDVLMPGQDGWSVLNILKSDSKLKDIPVVMQTILDESRRGFLMGASDFLTKPIERNRLIEVIKRLDHIDDLTALVVEDDANISELFVNWLEKEGWEVETAINGHEALQSFEKTPANLIILDLMMPKMDGFEFLEALNNQQLENHPSVIVVTAKDLSPEDHQRLNRGVELIVEKGGQTADNILKEIRQHLDTNTKRNS